ncbi:hypothetical protein B296_00046583 [Ensete ventricosum]|uniref:Uncharacterized protein n=1 Tax=Ensete ventricosum TaxID=4639 RepID=A0A426Z3F5_ENSVE|nr:hypothetical protein B296_00046583 [Ensete ventricosum]
MDAADLEEAMSEADLENRGNTGEGSTREQGMKALRRSRESKVGIFAGTGKACRVKAERGLARRRVTEKLAFLGEMRRERAMRAEPSMGLKRAGPVLQCSTLLWGRRRRDEIFFMEEMGVARGHVATTDTGNKTFLFSTC